MTIPTANARVYGKKPTFLWVGTQVINPHRETRRSNIECFQAFAAKSATCRPGARQINDTVNVSVWTEAYKATPTHNAAIPDEAL